jgi:lysozyme family protein
MARGNLSACLAITLKHEGGYVDHPSDPGGATNMGITHKTLAGYRGKPVTKQEVRNLSLAEATKIYERNYWDKVNGDMLPYGVDLATLDGAVNSGVSRGGKWLQRSVGAKQDGRVGPETIRLTAANDPAATVRKMCAYRLPFVQGLGTWKVFGRGWSRRIADIEAKGVAMWLRFGAGWSADKTADEMARQAAAAGDKAAGNSKAAGGAGGGGVVVGGGDIAAGGTGWLWVVVAVAVVASVLLLVRAGQNRARAAAYEAEADEQVLDAMAGQ